MFYGNTIQTFKVFQLECLRCFLMLSTIDSTLVSKSLLKNCFLFSSVLAQSGDHFIDMPDQAEFLIDRIKNEKLCDWNNDWKVITLFVGVSQTKIYLFIFKYRINILDK
jgi:hypothetical protein